MAFSHFSRSSTENQPDWDKNAESPITQWCAWGVGGENLGFLLLTHMFHFKTKPDFEDLGKWRKCSLMYQFMSLCDSSASENFNCLSNVPEIWKEFLECMCVGVQTPRMSLIKFNPNSKDPKQVFTMTWGQNPPPPFYAHLLFQDILLLGTFTSPELLRDLVRWALIQSDPLRSSLTSDSSALD